MKTVPAFPEKRSKGKCAERARTQYSCQAVEVVGFFPRFFFVLVFRSVLKTNFSELRTTTIPRTQAKNTHCKRVNLGHFHRSVYTQITVRHPPMPNACRPSQKTQATPTPASPRQLQLESVTKQVRNYSAGPTIYPTIVMNITSALVLR